MNSKSKEFLKFLREKNEMVYYHLFSCLSEESLEDELSRIEENLNDDNWFTTFHKSIRQTDFFDLNTEFSGHMDMI